MPPTGPLVYHWDRGAGTNSWADGANWYNSLPSRNNSVPLAGADLVFGGLPSGTAPQVINQHTANLSVRSLWFEAGRDYTLQGSGSFKFSGSGPLISVLAGGHAANRYTLDLPLEVTAGGGQVEIHNYSAGLLDIRKTLNLTNNSLSLYGGATHIQGVSGTASPTITIGGLSDQLTTLILSGSASVTVADKGLLITRSAHGGEVTLQDGSTFALGGNMIFGPSYYNTSFVQGSGVVRQEGAAPIGAIYNEGGDLSSGLNQTQPHLLGGDTTFGGRAGRADRLSINYLRGNSHALTKVGSGLITIDSIQQGLSGINLNGGVLALPSLGVANLRFDGGMLRDGGSSFTLGTAAGQIRWIGDGGFDRGTVTLNNGAELFWGAGRFVPNGRKLLLVSRYSGDQGVSGATLTNAINLGAGLREVRVERGVRYQVGAQFVRAELSGILSDDDQGGGILKSGPGLLWISGANTYTGATRIREGALRGNIPSASLIELDGGVLGLDGNFTRGRFGTGARITWLGSGGFAAYGANRSVRIDNQTTTEIGWGWSNFVPHGEELRFGHYTADAAVIWDRALNFGNAMRTIRVERGLRVGTTPNLVDLIVNRALNNSAKTGGLRLVGDGRADLTADSSNLDSNRLEISGVELRLATAAARLGAIGNIHLSEGGRLSLTNNNNSGTDSAQIDDATALTLDAGEVRYEGRAGGALAALPSTEKVGNLVLSGGANTIHIEHRAGAAGYTELKIEALQRAATSRATLNLTINAAYSATGRVRFGATTSLANHMIGGITPWATINGQDWATTDPSNPNYLSAYSAYTTGNTHSGNYLAGSNNSSNTATVTFGTVTLNSLMLYHYDVYGSGYQSAVAQLNGALTLSSGGLLANDGIGSNSDSFSNRIQGTGTLKTAASRPLYTHVYRHRLEFTGSTRVVGGIDWVKTGPAALHYKSTGTSQIRSLYVHQGTMELSAGAINTTGEVYIGDGAGRDELRLVGGTNRLANRPKVTLRGTPYGRGAEFGADEDQATLALVNGAYQSLRGLHIIDRGTLDFSGGSPSAPNRLFLDTISFNNDLAQLFVRGWHEYSDYLLIKKTAFAAGQWAQKLKQIYFDGYSLDYDLLASDYNDDYFQISPWGKWSAQAAPEPSTYGAILGAMGLSLVAWRKRRVVCTDGEATTRRQ